MKELVRLEPEPDLIIQGGASGADRLAKKWALHNGVNCQQEPALWQLLFKALKSTFTQNTRQFVHSQLAYL
jgi:hypothetical protein